MSIKRRVETLEKHQEAKQQAQAGPVLAVVDARGKTPAEVDAELAELEARLRIDTPIIILDI